MQDLNQCPVRLSDSYGLQFITDSKHNQEEYGQYFTPLEISDYMASMVNLPASDQVKVLDPGAGGGVLIASLIKHLVKLDTKNEKSYHAVLYEIDTGLIPTLEKAMSFLMEWCSAHNSKFSYIIKNEDYILANAHHLNESSSFLATETFDIVISNPPYFKISKDDKRAVACSKLIFGQPNIYSLFMGVSASQLKEEGQFVFITPRSFTSGQYFKAFRSYFFNMLALKSIHIFESRTDSFDRDSVLQENIISYGHKTKNKKNDKISIHSSTGRTDLKESKTLVLDSTIIVDSENENTVCLPTSLEDSQLLSLVNSWDNSLLKMGLKISTGPVVPFRATENLQKEKTQSSVPLLWIQHILPMRIKFPLDSFRKHQWFSSVEGTRKLLVEDQNMILMRRFSPKEDFRRLTVAPYKKGTLQFDLLGLENHLNYIYSPQKKFDLDEVYGLAAFLNSRFFDSYFRITNGNTQVSATELKSAKLPSIDIIKAIGRMIIDANVSEHLSIDLIVDEVLDLEGEKH